MERDHMTGARATVSRYWGTGIVIGDVDLTGILRDDSDRVWGASGPAFERIRSGSFLADEAALEAQFLASMNAVASAQGSGPVERAEIDIQIWRGGYDLPATSYPADVVGWCFLAAGPPARHTESGALALADPRAGSALTAMPGLPWGRQLMVRPTPGAHAAAPGWLTCSVVPVEEGQYAVVAVASAGR
jgi:hypothetical protein